MRRLLLIFLLFPVSLLAQKSSTISGRVVDNKHIPIPYSVVVLLNKDSVVIKGNITDSLGKYEFDLPSKGTYLIKSSMPGHKAGFSALIEVGTADVSVADIIMDEGNNTLGDLIVTGHRKLYEMRADKMVMNIENSVLAVGNSAFELLKKAPGVSVDQNDNIMLKGQPCRIYTNDKPTYLDGPRLAEYLKSMPAESISKIEIISNPSSRYDAEGSSGIINLVMKKSKKSGFNGSASTGLGYGKYPKANESITLNYRKGGLNLFCSDYLGYSESYNRLTYNTIINKTSGTAYYDRDQYWHPYTRFGNYMAGADYTIGTKTTLGVQVTGSSDATNANTTNTTVGSDEQHNPNTLIDVLVKNSSGNTNTTYNLSFKTQLDSTGSAINADADYVRYSAYSDDDNTNRFLDPSGISIRTPYVFNSSQPSEIAVRSIKADFSYTLLKEIKMETGLKYSLVDADNIMRCDSLIGANWVRDNNRSDHFVFNERISAAYITLSRTLGKLSLQAGTRMEHTTNSGVSYTLADTSKRNYLNFFPSGFATYSIDKANELNLSYTKRIARPRYQSLNPFRSYIDLLTLFQGNPYLSPAYTHALEIRHGYKQTLFTSLSYNYTTGEQVQAIYQDKVTGTTTNTYSNSATSDRLSLSILYTFNVTKHWSNDLSMDAQYGHDRSRIPEYSYETTSAGGDISSDNSITLPKDYKIQTAFYYSLPTRSGLAMLRSDYGWDLGVQKQIFGDRLLFKVKATNIIGTSSYRAHIVGDNLDIKWVNKWEGRRLNINCTWKFGKKDLKEKATHTTASQDEAGRIK